MFFIIPLFYLYSNNNEFLRVLISRRVKKKKKKKKKKNVDRVEETSFVETYIVARISNALLIPGRE